jgi:hypothetical protein
LFSEAVRGRDGKICGACGEQKLLLLDGAHVFPLEWKNKLSQYKDVGLGHLYETSNGICLCKVCHRYFDDGLWTVEKGKFLISDALQSDSSQVLSSRHGKYFPFYFQGEERKACAFKPTPSEMFPSPKVWAVRREYYEEKTRQRQQEGKEAAIHCPVCNKAFKIQGVAFRNHVASCKGIQQHFHTPQKPAKKKGQTEQNGQ